MSNRIKELERPKWEREAAPSAETYNQHANGKVRLKSFVTDLVSLRKLWGAAAVDKALAEGRIKIMEDESMPENPERADADFIFMSFNLIPLYGGQAAIAPGAIVDMEYDEEANRWRVNMHGGMVYVLTQTEMVELEMNIKRRSEDAKILRRENIKSEMRTQAEVVQELTAEANRVAPVAGKIIDPRPRRH